MEIHTAIDTGPTPIDFQADTITWLVGVSRAWVLVSYGVLRQAWSGVAR